MSKRKHEPKKKPNEGSADLGDLSTRDLLRSIRKDLKEQANRGGIGSPQPSEKPDKSDQPDPLAP